MSAKLFSHVSFLGILIAGQMNIGERHYANILIEELVDTNKIYSLLTH